MLGHGHLLITHEKMNGQQALEHLNMSNYQSELKSGMGKSNFACKYI